MKSAVIFKNILRELRKKLNNEIAELNAVKNNQTKEFEEFREKSIVNFYYKLPASSFMSNLLERKSKSVQHIISVCRSYKETSQNIQSLEQNVKYITEIINSYDNDMVKKAINVQELLLLLGYIEEHYDIEYKVIAECFGLNIVANMKAIGNLKSEKTYEQELIEELSEYFNNDGSFKHNTDINNFMSLLNKCFHLYSLYETGYLTIVLINRPNIWDVIKGMANILEERNNSQEDKKEPVEVLEEEKTSVINPNDLSELRKYYRNYRLIKMPEDEDEFANLLDRCGIDELEKRYILNLIDENKNEPKQENISKYLEETDLEEYNSALQVLSSIHFTNPTYNSIVSIIINLKSVCDRLDACQNDEEKVSLLAKKDELIESLQVITDSKNDSIKNNNIELSTNHLLFLSENGETCFNSDLRDKTANYNIENVMYVLKKVRKENRGNFRRVLAEESFPYTPYVYMSKGVSIYFIEVDAGIYLIVGCAPAGIGYQKMKNRILKQSAEIKNIENEIKMADFRNDLLNDNERVLNSIESNAVSRVRKPKVTNQ